MFSKHANVILKSQGTGLSRGCILEKKPLHGLGGFWREKSVQEYFEGNVCMWGEGV